MRQAGQHDQLPTPGGAYSHGVRLGQVVYTAGQGGFDPRSSQLVGDDVAAQTRQALANVRAALEANGASMNDVIRVGVFLADLGDFGAMNLAYQEAFADPLPARTTVAVGLPTGMKVEIDAMAVVHD